MVMVRAGRVEHHLQEQQIHHLRRRQHLEQQAAAISVAEAAVKMFKVPSSSSSHPIPTFAQQQQHQQSEMKRKWQEAFIQRGESRDTMLNLGAPDRPHQRQKTPPLTIFYAGSVNVYDNVPEDMVRALMTLAASKSSRPAAAAAMLNQLGRLNNNNNNNNNNHMNMNMNMNTFGFPVLSHVQQHHQQTSLVNHVAGFPVVSQLNHSNSNGNKNGFSNFLSIGTNNINNNNNSSSNNNNNNNNNNVGSSGFSTFHNTSLSLNSFRMEEKQSSAAAAAPVGPTTTITTATTTAAAAAAAAAPSSSTTTTTTTTIATGTPTSSAGPNPATDLRRMSQLSPTTRMQLLPAGLPQARRASIQRFLEKRKQKQVNNNNNNQGDEEAVAGSGGASGSASSASPDKSCGHEEAAGTQVPHFLRRSS